MQCQKKCNLINDICTGCNRTMTEIKSNYQEIHPRWPETPPDIKDNLPKATKKKSKKKLCPKYYHQCWQTECNESIIPSGQCID